MKFSQTLLFQNIFEAPYWSHLYFGNALSEYVLALVAFVILIFLLRFIQFITLLVLGTVSKKTRNNLDDTLIQIVKSIRPRFYTFIAFYIAVRTFLALGPVAERVVSILLIIWIVYQVIFALQILVEFAVKRFLIKDNDAGAESMAHMLGVIVKVILWIVGIVVILGNVGVDVTAFIAGLGVAGLAIGFALQPVLSDLFASFSLYFDKPFKVGDFIGTGDDYGTVEYIGIKSTRLVSYSGEQLVLANSELTNSKIRNYSIRERRHVTFNFGVDQETPLEKLRIISEGLRKIIEEEENVDEVERAWFQKFGDSAYIFEGAYYMAPPTYSEYLKLQEKINLKISEWLEKESIKLAYPTQTVYQYNVEGEGK